jgi:hypothetical protein
MHAIETVYQGYRFRSRLEARWAVFFESLQVPFEYEREGYRLQSGWYLPDFWLPMHQAWIEIKGRPPTLNELHLAMNLRDETTFPVVIFTGPPNWCVSGYCYAADIADGSAGTSEWPMTRWGMCRLCGLAGLTWGNSTHEIYTTELDQTVGACLCGVEHLDIVATEIVQAVLASRAARFDTKKGRA